ncbi:hypothetical protein [Desulfosarcina cetonica]|nr:hypothetical protein [Desulfosarcina cetonica]
MIDQMKEITEAIEAARQWRNENGYAGRGGRDRPFRWGCAELAGSVTKP